MGDLIFVECSRCGICCADTMMELSSEDIKRLEGKGYRVEEFVIIDDGVTRLRNVNGYCFFYSTAEKKCLVYDNKPWGCYIYPVVHMENEGPIVDSLCPMGHTISKRELRTKGKKLDKLLKMTDNYDAQIAQRLYMWV